MAAKNVPNHDTPTEEIIVMEGVKEENTDTVPETVTVGGHTYALIQEDSKLKSMTNKLKTLASNKKIAAGVSAAVLIGAGVFAAKKRGTTGEETEDNNDSV